MAVFKDYFLPSRHVITQSARVAFSQQFEEARFSFTRVCDSELRYFFNEQGHIRLRFQATAGQARVFIEAYIGQYAADGNPRRTPLIGKRAISKLQTS